MRANGLLFNARSVNNVHNLRVCRNSLQTRATVPSSVQTDVYDELATHAELLQTPRVVNVRTTPLGRGLVAAADVARGPIASVPIYNALVLCDDPLGGISVFSDRQQREWQERHGEMPPELADFIQGEERWDARMAAWLLWLRRHKGYLWRRYLALLPREEDMACLLNFQGPDEMDELQFADLKREAEIQANWASHLHRQLFASAGGGGAGTAPAGSSSASGRRKAVGQLASLDLSRDLKTSLWALSMVRSRTFSDDVNGEALTLMVPYCDLANHGGNEHNTTFCVSRDRRSFELRAVEAIAAGQEALITYGEDKPNSMLLRDYGFVIHGNPHDRVSFADSQGGPDQGQQQQRQQQQNGLNAYSLLEAAGFKGDLTTGDIQPLGTAGDSSGQDDGSICSVSLTVARRRAALLSLPLRKAPGEDGGGGGLFGWASAKAWSESGRAPPAPLAAAAVPAERAAVAALRGRLREELAALPTSIEADLGHLLDFQRPAAAFASGGAPNSGGGGGGALGTVKGSRQRRETALRARLERKLLMQEAIRVLESYDLALAGR